MSVNPSWSRSSGRIRRGAKPSLSGRIDDAGIHAAAGATSPLRAAEPTAQETAKIQVVNDFCEAWRAHDVTKIMSYFAENCAYRPLETMETAKGSEAVENEIKRFVNNVERFEILETWARGASRMRALSKIRGSAKEC